MSASQLEAQNDASPFANHYPQNKTASANKVLNPEDIPLRYGRTFQPFPSPHPSLKFDPIQWYWVPGFSFDIYFILSALAFLLYLSSMITFISAPRISGKLGGGSFLLILAAIVTYLRVNLGINQALRTAICRCYAKSEIAMRIWETADARDHIFHKDVFHSEKSYFYELAVLRDGSVDIRNGNERIHSEAKTLDIGMQASLNADNFKV
ncbi:unnamed protein product [Agarophyton chilense]|eukprot:gb/GEZJ01000450.1/.p1 GENE.gb/GEZJ01000450.1/~~gb/GEZJ01000450.1/.p1  ORF type:complete len:209 (-),score=33.89 gb/GEZJ01000450.1/:484-1110(-)